MKQRLLLVTILIVFNSCAQELTCKDFMNGEFYVPADEETPLSFTIIRRGNFQTEIIQDPKNKLGSTHNKTLHTIIEWIDDCTYRLRYDENKTKLSEHQKFINENNGVLTELIKIEGNCFYYKSTLNVQGQIKRIDGKMCKK